MKCSKCKTKMVPHSEYVDDNKGNHGMCRYHECPTCHKVVYEMRDEDEE